MVDSWPFFSGGPMLQLTAFASTTNQKKNTAQVDKVPTKNQKGISISKFMYKTAY